MNEVYPSSPQDSFHEETLFSCFVGKRVRDASIYVSKKYRSSFYSRAIATIATNVTMLQCYMLHVTLRKINFGHFRAQRIVYINNILFIYTILWTVFSPLFLNCKLLNVTCNM